MIVSSLALVLAASTLAAPVSNPIHFHPRVKMQDDRVAFNLSNPNQGFRDITIDGHTYTVSSHETISVKAPAGTLIYAGNLTFTHKPGDLLLQVTPALNNARVRLD